MVSIISLISIGIVEGILFYILYNVNKSLYEYSMSISYIVNGLLGIIFGIKQDSSILIYFSIFMIVIGIALVIEKLHFSKRITYSFN